MAKKITGKYEVSFYNIDGDRITRCFKDRDKANAQVEYLLANDYAARDIYTNYYCYCK